MQQLQKAQQIPIVSTIIMINMNAYSFSTHYKIEDSNIVQERKTMIRCGKRIDLIPQQEVFT